VASHIITALQTISSRFVDPVDPIVLSVTQFNAGTEAYNVIPSSAHLAGTLRCFSADLRRNIPHQVYRIVQTIASAWDVECTIEWNAKASNPLRRFVFFAHLPFFSSIVLTNVLVARSATRPRLILCESRASRMLQQSRRWAKHT